MVMQCPHSFVRVWITPRYRYRDVSLWTMPHKVEYGSQCSFIRLETGVLIHSHIGESIVYHKRLRGHALLLGSTAVWKLELRR